MAINNDKLISLGMLQKAVNALKDYTENQVGNEAILRDAKDQALNQLITDLQKSFETFKTATGEGIDKRMQEIEAKFEGVSADLKSFFEDTPEGASVKTMQENISANAEAIGVNAAAIAANAEDIADNVAAIALLNDADKTKVGSIAKALDDLHKLISDEIDADVLVVDGKIDTEIGRAKAAEEANAAAIAKLNGGAEEEGSVAKAVADAVKAEKDRAEGAEGKLQEAIDVLEEFVLGQENEEGKNAIEALEDRVKANEDNITKLDGDVNVEGSVKKQIKAVVDAQALVDAAQDEKIAKNEAFVAAQPAVDAEQDRRLGVLEADAPIKQAAIEAAQKAADDAQDAADAAQADVDALEKRLDDEGGLVDRIEANEANIARLDGAVDVEGSVKKQIKDAIDAVNQAADGLADRVEAVENFRDVTYPAAEAKVREDFAAADATNLQAAKDYADQQITALVDSAPDAMNTLNELAEAINANQGVYDAYVAEHATAMTKMKEDLQAEIDADVKVVVDAQKLVNDAQAETNEDFEERIAANEAFVAAQPAIDLAQNNKIAALEAKFDGENSVDARIAAAQKAADDAAAAVVTEQGRAEGQEAAIRSEFAAVDATIRQEMATEAARVNKKIADDITAESALRVAEEERIAGLVATEEGRAKGVEQGLDGRIAGLEAKFEGDNSVDAKIAAAQAAAEAKAAELDKADREAQAEIDSAQDAAIALKVAKADYDVKVKALDDEDARIAGLVKAEEDRAKGVEEEQAGKIAALEAKVGADKDGEAEATGLFAKVNAAQAAANAAQADADALEERLDVDGGLVDRLEAVEEFVAGHNDEARDDRIAALEVKVGKDVNGEEPATGLFLEIDNVNAAVVAEAAKAREEEGKLAQAIADEATAARAAEKANADAIVDMKDANKEGTLAKQIADNAAAIAKEVEDREAAIGDSVIESEQYATALVKALKFEVANDQLKLMLQVQGEGEEITSVDITSFDLANEDDMNEILAGLEAPEKGEGE